MTSRTRLSPRARSIRPGTADSSPLAPLLAAYASGRQRTFQQALQAAARAHGMAAIAAATGLGRESLYKTLRVEAQPRFDTIRRVLAALGVSLALQIEGTPVASRRSPAKPAARSKAHKPATANASGKPKTSSARTAQARKAVGKVAPTSRRRTARNR